MIPLTALYKFYRVVSNILDAETNGDSSLTSALWYCLVWRLVAGAVIGVYFAEVSAQLIFLGPLDRPFAFRGLVIVGLVVTSVYTSGSIASAAATGSQRPLQLQERRQPLLSVTGL